MPNYNYECLNCNKIFTITKSMTDESTPPCPHCKSVNMVNRVWGCVNLGGMTNKSGTSSCGGCSGGHCQTCN